MNDPSEPPADEEIAEWVAKEESERRSGTVNSLVVCGSRNETCNVKCRHLTPHEPSLLENNSLCTSETSWCEDQMTMVKCISHNRFE